MTREKEVEECCGARWTGRNSSGFRSCGHVRRPRSGRGLSRSGERWDWAAARTPIEGDKTDRQRRLVRSFRLGARRRPTIRENSNANRHRAAGRKTALARGNIEKGTLPRRGEAILLPVNDGTVKLKVLETAATPVNQGKLFAHYDHWALAELVEEPK